MPNDETLNDRAISTMMEIQKAREAIQPFNDYGDATGFCDEHDQLHNDAWAILGSIRARASRLQLRVKRHARDVEAARSGQNANVDLPDTAAQDSASKSNSPAVSG